MTNRRRGQSLVRFMLTHTAVGFCGGAVLGILLIATNVGGLRGLVTQTDSGWIGAAVLCYCLGLTFGGLSCGAGVMRLGEEEQREPRGGHPIRSALTLALIPIRVRATDKR